MTVWIVRHTHAIDAQSPGAAADARRPLSARGRRDARRVGRFLRRADGFPAAPECWHSGLVRARETAELVTTAAGSDVRLRVVAGLAPERAPAVVAALLEKRSRGDVILVGHEPHLGALASLLVTGRREPVVFPLKKGAVLALERTAERHRHRRRRWIVRWLLAPELVKR